MVLWFWPGLDHQQRLERRAEPGVCDVLNLRLERRQPVPLHRTQQTWRTTTVRTGVYSDTCRPLTLTGSPLWCQQEPDKVKDLINSQQLFWFLQQKLTLVIIIKIKTHCQRCLCSCCRSLLADGSERPVSSSTPLPPLHHWDHWSRRPRSCSYWKRRAKNRDHVGQ